MRSPAKDARSSGRRPPKDLTLSEAVYRRIRHDILSGSLAPGQRLVLSGLRERHAASFSVVREALSRLVGERLVRATPQQGFRVAAPSPAELRDMISVYRSLELMAIRRAFAYGDVVWEARVLAACHTLVRTPARDATDPEQASKAFAETRAAFHATLLGACDSPCLLALWQSLYDALVAQQYLCTSTALQRIEIASKYEAVTQAVLARNVDRAIKLLARCDPFPAGDVGS